MEERQEWHLLPSPRHSTVTCPHSATRASGSVGTLPLAPEETCRICRTFRRECLHSPDAPGPGAPGASAESANPSLTSGTGLYWIRGKRLVLFVTQIVFSCLSYLLANGLFRVHRLVDTISFCTCCCSCACCCSHFGAFPRAQTRSWNRHLVVVHIRPTGPARAHGRSVDGSIVASRIASMVRYDSDGALDLHDSSGGKADERDIDFSAPPALSQQHIESIEWRSMSG